MKNRILFFLAILLPVLPKCAIAQIDFSTVLTQPECANTNTGKIEVIPSGSAGPFTITLIKGSSNQGPAERLVTSPGAYTFTGLGAGGYSVLVSSPEPSCSQVHKKVQINNPPDFFGSVYQIDSSCAPCDVNLIADFQPPGNFSYAWNTNQTTSKITGVCDGSYTVTVTKLSTGCQKQFSISAANETPSLFINLPGSICPDQSNTFTFEVPSTSSGPCVEVNPDSVVWDFGDNTGSFDVSPSHSYSSSGTYTIVLTLNGGLSATETITVNPLNLSFSSNSGCLQPLEFSFSPMISCSSFSEFLWNFGDPNSSLNTSNEQYPSHVFSSAGMFTVTLIVGNQTTSSTVTVEDNPNPSPQLYVTSNSCSSFPFQRAFLSNIQCAQTYKWNFGDPSSGLANSSTELYPSHNFSGPGSYLVTLISDSGQSASVSASITVVVDNPVTISQSPDGVLSFPGDSVSIGPQPESGFVYVWQNGSDVTPLQVNQPGVYILTKRNPANPNACMAFDTMLVTYCGQFALGNKMEFGDEVVSVYPNPASSRFFVAGLSDADFSVVNLQGKVVLTGCLKDYSDGISTNGIPSGLYFFRWKSDQNGSGSLKFLIWNR